MGNPPSKSPFSSGSEVYATFCGNIDQASVQRIFQAADIAANGKAAGLHLLFQSPGGLVADGICLYNFFKALTTNLTLYNVGSIQSIATIAYLGAKRRKSSVYGTFMLHRTISSPQGANAFSLEAAIKLVGIDDQRTEAILRNHVRFNDDQWNQLNRGDLVLTAEESIQCGVADEIGEFSPPRGIQIFNI